MKPSPHLDDTETVPISAQAAKPVQQMAVASKENISENNDSIPPEDPSVKKSWKTFGQSFDKLLYSIRYSAVKAAPRFIVNNSSNFFGFTHVLTEITMFKASLKGGMLVEHPSGNLVKDSFSAVKRVYLDSFRGSRPKDFDFKQLFRGNVISNFKDQLFSTGAATEREALSQAKQGIARTNIKLGNPWQTRSTFVGLLVWTLSAIIPDKKSSDEEIESMALLRATNPIGYVGERLRQAIWFPEWDSHKRQVIGLGFLSIGITSMLGAWRNHIKTPTGPQYSFNRDYFLTSLLSFFGGIPLLFASDDQRGFGAYGAIMTGRLFFLPGSIARKLKGGEKGAGWYFGSMASFQAENWGQALIGGAEKNKDGTIVDHNEERKKAAEKAAEIRLAKKKGHASPSNTIALDQSEHSLAMPERAKAAETSREPAVANV